MAPFALLTIYCLLCVIGSLAGGWIPLVVRLTHRRMQIAISFVSGVILGIGLLHLLPHSFAVLGSIDATVIWALAGFLFMFFLERFFHFHHHDAPEAAESETATHVHAHSDHDHDHAHDHHAHDAAAHSLSNVSWVSAAIGLSLHGLVDGVALAAAVQAEASDLVRWAGLGTALAIALHKPFDSLTIGALLAAAKKSPATRQTINLLYALVTPLGVLAFYLAAGGFSAPAAGLGQALGFAAGAFLCIATSDLLPELQFHRHDRVGLSIALLAGIALAWGTGLFEAPGHHEHGPSHSDHDH